MEQRCSDGFIPLTRHRDKADYDDGIRLGDGRKSMNLEKLRNWLKLPDGPWPPDYYTLAGLSPGRGDPAEIETRILERLELLRRYQLPHPDEATEGMNLLARALDTLTDPASRREYDRSIGLKVKTNLDLTPDVDDFDALFEGVPLLPTSPAPVPFVDVDVEEPAPAAPSSESILPDVILLPDVEDEPEADDDPEFIDEPKSGATPLPTAVLLPDLPQAIILPELPAAARLDDARPSRRRTTSPAREVYAELARVRRVLRIWERARPYLVDTEKTLSRRADTIALMGCLAELRPLLPTVTDLIGSGSRPGSIVSALARQRLAFDTFRSLLPSQRESLAKDFRAAHYRLAGYYDELRDEVRRRNEKGVDRRVIMPFVRGMVNYPEWALVPIGLVLLVLAIVRSM